MRMSFFAISEASIPSKAIPGEKLSRKCPWMPITSMAPARPPMAPERIIPQIITFFGGMPTYSEKEGFCPTWRSLYPQLV